jgi:hypothetical protein
VIFSTIVHLGGPKWKAIFPLPKQLRPRVLAIQSNSDNKLSSHGKQGGRGHNTMDQLQPDGEEWPGWVQGAGWAGELSQGAANKQFLCYPFLAGQRERVIVLYS